jgi:hypothetical protein
VRLTNLKDWQVKALELRGKMGSRAIGELVGKGKSTINQFFSTYDSFNEELDGVEELEVTHEYDLDLDVLSEHSDFSVSNLAKRLRAAQKSNNQLRKVQRELFDSELDTESFFKRVQGIVGELNKEPYSVRVGRPLNRSEASVGTLEILFSDMQIGKLCADYNTEVAKQRMVKFANGIQDILENTEYKIERIIIASLGDIVEDHLKHGVGSASACDTGLAEQMADAIELIWKELLTPLFMLGIKTDVMCIAGNHASSQHKGMDVYRAGRFAYDYPIYRALEMLTKTAEFDNVNFIIPEGVFGYLNIYGNYVIYEHGYFNQASEKGMNDQMKKRGQQIKKHVEFYRQGDKHNVQMFDCGKIVLNGAFFGNDSNATEYSGVLGFSAVPAQVVMIHSPEEKVGRNTVKEFHTIQLA